MKRLLIATFFFTIAQAAQAQKWNIPTAADYPRIRTQASAIREFVPRTWKIIGRADGDLNGDELPDSALVIKGQSPKFLYGDSVGLDPFDTNPRMLLLVFGVKGGKFRLVESSNSFIIPRDNPSMSEPFESVRIRKGVLIFKFEEWYSAGTWFTAKRTYKFKYLRNQFLLIGVDKTSSMRNEGVEEARSYNFLTKKIKTTISSYDKNVKAKSSWRNFDAGELKTLRTLPKPFEWEIEYDYYL